MRPPGRHRATRRTHSFTISDRMRSPSAAVSPVGVLGDPTTATAAEGERILSEMVNECVRRVARWRPGPDGMLA
ncbi:hypothetical protein MAHJHV63_50290 [Mycobacterium avium subsp. hominissuis]